MARFFTKAEAERLLAEVAPAIQDAIRSKAEYLQFEGRLQELRRRVTMGGGVRIDRAAFLGIQQQRDSRASELKSAIDRVHGFGCLVKDLDKGLIDFPTLFHGREVYLCWKLGEHGIQFWHGVDEGFAGRKPVDQDFLDNHRGDAAN